MASGEQSGFKEFLKGTAIVVVALGALAVGVEAITD